MPESYPNARSSTGTETRSWDVSFSSGMCPTCIKDCTTLCEIGKSAFRGREVLYPNPEEFGKSTSASNKDYVLDWSGLQIMVDVIGAHGIEADSDVAIFPNADVSTSVGGVKLKIPVLVPGLGSTKVAKDNWDGLAVGTAISGTIMTIGENVCGMDPDSTIENGKVKESPDLRYRIEKYREFWDGEHGDIVVQTNVEDQRLGVDLYALNELGVNIIERKWGQGAKAIGGEVRVDNLDRAILLKKRGYVVLPDPEDKDVQAAFKKGVFKTFERHSRVGMPEERGFIEDIEWLRDSGAKKVFLKTGAYRPEVVAFTMKVASEAKIEALTFDGAGGGTGMSPVPMMQECSTPTVFLEAQVLKCAEILKKQGRHVPDLVMAGGMVNETQVFKAIAMSNFGDGPHVVSSGMARSAITAVFKGDYYTQLAKEGNLPMDFVNKYGNDPDIFFVASTELQHRFGDDYKKLPPGAIGLYTYFVDRIGYGLQQLMAGSRKFKLNLLSRNDLASLTERAAKVTGLPLVEELEQEAMERILG
ncbi:MAG: glutamate synthase-related protein [Candidatus Hydrothermarchaeaceae archaeon]